MSHPLLAASVVAIANCVMAFLAASVELGLPSPVVTAAFAMSVTDKSAATLQIPVVGYLHLLLLLSRSQSNNRCTRVVSPQRIQGMLRSARQSKGKNSLRRRRSSVVMCLAVHETGSVCHVLLRALPTTIHLCRWEPAHKYHTMSLRSQITTITSRGSP